MIQTQIKQSVKFECYTFELLSRYSHLANPKVIILFISFIFISPEFITNPIIISLQTYLNLSTQSPTMNSQQQQANQQMNLSIKNFIANFNKHCQKAHPKVFNEKQLIKKVQQCIFYQTQPVTQVDVKPIEEQLAVSLKNAYKNHKNGVLLIGPPGVGKTAFMKYYARRQSKILINANCANIIPNFKSQITAVINLLFEMGNFSSDAILFFDDIDLIMNDQNVFENGQLIRETLLKNIQNKDYETPIVYSTNKPWKIDDKNFLQSIYCSIEIPISSYQKRKALIEMIIKDSSDQNLDTSMLDVQDIAQRTLNFMNSDIYVLIRQMMMEPLSEMLGQGKSVEEINNSQFKVSKEHIESAYKKIRPSLLVEEINEYKKWQDKFDEGKW